MDFKTTYPDFAAIEEQVRRARAERSVAVAHAIVGLIEMIGRGVRKFGELLGGGLAAAAERERSVIESDPFLKRSVPRY
jgi:hypothetical protein